MIVANGIRTRSALENYFAGLPEGVAMVKLIPSEEFVFDMQIQPGNQSSAAIRVGIYSSGACILSCGHDVQFDFVDHPIPKSEEIVRICQAITEGGLTEVVKKAGERIVSSKGELVMKGARMYSNRTSVWNAVRGLGKKQEVVTITYPPYEAMQPNKS